MLLSINPLHFEYKAITRLKEEIHAIFLLYFGITDIAELRKILEKF